MNYVDAAVPHSGNVCSGLCRTPCDHPDCWQCAEHRDKAGLAPAAPAPTRAERHASMVKGTFGRQPRAQVFVPSKTDKTVDKLVAERERQKALLDEKARQVSAYFAKQVERANNASVLGAMSAQSYKDTQKTTITRGALEALAERAGVAMDWNGGDPVFHDRMVAKDIEARDAVRERAERALLDEKVKELERIAAQHQAGLVSDAAAASLAKAAATQMDQMASEVLKQSAQDLLRKDIEENEKRVIAQMKESGATDADIEAAKALIGWKPPTEFIDATLDPARVQSYAALHAQLQGLSVTGISYDEFGSAPSGEALTEAFKKALRKRLPAGLKPGNYIIHPSDYEDALREAKGE